MMMETEQHDQKRRRLHLDVVESVRLSQSEEGTASLRQPVARTHPRASSSQAMAPRYRSRRGLRSPRMVNGPGEGQACSVSPAAQGSECAGDMVGNSDEEFDSGPGKGKLKGRAPSRVSGLKFAKRQSGGSGGREVDSLDKVQAVASTEKQENTNRSQGCMQSSSQSEWGSEEEEQAMVEQSSNEAVHLLSTLGGFRPAASLQQPSSGSSWNSASAVAQFPQSNFSRGQSSKKPGRKQLVKDSSQCSIMDYMSCRIPSSTSSFSTSVAPCTSGDREGFEPQVSSEAIVYGSPSKMYSPIKKVSNSKAGSVYTVSDEPEASHRVGHGSPSSMSSPVKKALETETVYVISDDSSSDCWQEKPPERCSTQSADISRSNSAVKKLFSSFTAPSCSSQKNGVSAVPSSVPRSARPNGTKRKGKTPRAVDRGVKRKTSKHDLDPCQRTLASIPSTLSLCDINYDDADKEDFTSVPACVPPVRLEIDVGLTFGLLSDSVVEVVEENWFQRLPQEVVENIFCNLPMIDLCLSLSRVCVNWSNIITNPTFMPWKKLYHKLKKGDTESKAHLGSIMQQENMDSCGLLKLISFMQSFKTVTPDNNVRDMLQPHPKYKWALVLLEEKAPQCLKNKEPNPWSLICAMVVVSATVEDIHCALRLLTSPRSHLLCTEVLECFYCIAAFLLDWKTTAPQLSALGQKGGDRRERKAGEQVVALAESKRTSVVRGLHYRALYALYLYENSFSSSHAMLQQAMGQCTGQQSMVKYSRGDTETRLTHEQLRIVNHTPDLTSGEIVKIFAYAGTGKTTTLLRYTQVRPHLKFLLMVFNKSVSMHAKKQFPPNVTCKTGHGLAFAVTGQRYQARQQLNAGTLRVYDMAMALKTRKTKGNLFVRAKMVLETLKNYLSSSDEMITSQHVPQCRYSDVGRLEIVEHSDRMLYAEDATYYWDRMKNLNDVEVKMTHDGYLKLYQLKKPTLKGYDIILVDEAQDLTPALLDVIEHQRQPKIFVGDQHQQIYAFRGAVNAMEKLTADKVFYLTQSFRFGPEIAQVANTLLENLKNETAQNIVGHGAAGIVSGEQVGQLAVLCRTNFSVFTEAVDVCRSAETSLRIAFVGGLNGLGLPMLRDIYALMLSVEDRRRGKLQIDNKFIASFRNLAELENHARKVSDIELLAKVRIVRFYQLNLPQCVEKITARAIDNLQQADVVFSTVHKAKGLEFSTVKIAQDFLELDGLSAHEVHPGNSRLLQSVREEDVNILYVAVTRAKRALIMSQALRTMFMCMGGGCYHPVLTEKLKQDGVEMRCLTNGKEFKAQALTVYRPQVTLGNKEMLAAGVVSPAFLQRANSGFACLFGGDDDEYEDIGDDNLVPDGDIRHFL